MFRICQGLHGKSCPEVVSAEHRIKNRRVGRKVGERRGCDCYGFQSLALYSLGTQIKIYYRSCNVCDSVGESRIQLLSVSA